MRVAFNRLTALRPKTGVGYHIDQLLSNLGRVAPLQTMLPFPGEFARSLMQLGQRLKRRKKSPGSGTGSAWKAALARTLASWNFRLFTSSHHFDLYHEPNFIPYSCDQPTVATIHDLSTIHHPQWHPTERARYHEKALPGALRQVRHWITVSESVRKEAIETLSLPPENVTFIPNGFRENIKVLSDAEVRTRIHRAGLPENYLLYVGTLEPRKNLLTLMKAYCSLPAKVRQKTPLVLAGGWGWNYFDIAEYYLEHARHHQVLHLGYVPENLLVALYNGARALVFPSFYEGFGLPVLEMFSLGKAVLSSSADCLVELLEPHMPHIDPHDKDDWRLALEKTILDDDFCRQLQPKNVEHYRGYTWEKCARGTLDVYAKVLGKEAEMLSLEANRLAKVG